MEIMLRWAEDDFEALNIANGIEAVGGEVFSITFRSHKTHLGALAPHAQYVVWAKVKNKHMMDNADERIAAKEVKR